MKSIKNIVRGSVGISVFDSVRGSTMGFICYPIHGSVWDSVGNSVTTSQFEIKNSINEEY